MDGGKNYLATAADSVSRPRPWTLKGRSSATVPLSVVLDQAGIDACPGRPRGQAVQTPPAFSALKHKGKPLYHYARQGIISSRIRGKSSFCCLTGSMTAVIWLATQCLLHMRIVCSHGTYIRVLAADIGRSLGCGAYLIGTATRTASGLLFTLGQS